MSEPPRVSEPLVRIEDLTVRFATRERVVHAVNGVSLAVAGEDAQAMSENPLSD